MNAKRKEDLQDVILKAASKHFLSEGYDMVSTKTIAKEAGIAEGTIFNYFSSKAELFLEVIANHYSIENINGPDFELMKANITEMVMVLVTKNTGMIFKIPKKLLREVLSASLAIAKKNTKLFLKIIEADYKLIATLEEMFIRVQKSGLMVDCNAKVLSEAVFSFFTFELISYAFTENYTKEMVIKGIKMKIELLVKGL